MNKLDYIQNMGFTAVGAVALGKMRTALTSLGLDISGDSAIW